jgi:radical SAM protein with 4Fe4S-binding SPASM domain
MSFETPLIILKKIMTFSEGKVLCCLRPLVNIDDVIGKVSRIPTSLNFEVTNICNANCIFCGHQYLKRPQNILPMDLFKKALDEFSDLGGGGIGFTPTSGDPLIDKNFIEKIKYARSKKNTSGIGFFTNGILINKVGARSIITSGINAITISIPGFDSQTYSRIFRSDRWRDVEEGIFNILQENALARNKINICIGLKSDIPVWRLLKAPAYKKLRRFRFKLEYNVHFDNWGGLIKQVDLKGAMRLRHVPNKIEPCSLLYAGPTIMSNGDVTLCGCRDLNGDSELVVGNIANKSILEIWQDPRIENIRKGFYAFRYPKICRDCSFYNDLSCFRKQKIEKILRAHGTARAQ